APRCQAARGGFALGLGPGLAVVGSRHHVGKALADVDRRPLGRSDFLARRLGVVIVVVVEGVVACGRRRHITWWRVTLAAVATTTASVAIAPALRRLVTACGLVARTGSPFAR